MSQSIPLRMQLDEAQRLKGAIEEPWEKAHREAMRAWHARYRSQPTSYNWSISHASRRGGDALARLQDAEWPPASTVSEVYGSWAAARADAFPVS